MILVLDNRDSFTFNLVQALQTLGADVEVVHAPESKGAAPQAAAKSAVEAILDAGPKRIVIGPGPGRPESALTSLELIRREHEIPILGVCLGHQALGVAFGATVRRAPELVHGRTVLVTHDDRGVFQGVANPERFTRYNSLTLSAENFPTCLEVSATSADGDIMGVRHRERPIAGVQFHPESILSTHGTRLLRNFLSLAPVTSPGR